MKVLEARRIIEIETDPIDYIGFDLKLYKFYRFRVLVERDDFRYFVVFDPEALREKRNTILVYTDENNFKEFIKVRIWEHLKIIELSPSEYFDLIEEKTRKEKYWEHIKELVYPEDFRVKPYKGLDEFEKIKLRISSQIPDIEKKFNVDRKILYKVIFKSINNR